LSIIDKLSIPVLLSCTSHTTLEPEDSVGYNAKGFGDTAQGEGGPVAGYPDADGRRVVMKNNCKFCFSPTSHG
jgi:hypothetical protein